MSIPPDDRTVRAALSLPKLLEVEERRHRRDEAFYATLQPDYEALPSSKTCEKHGVPVYKDWEATKIASWEKRVFQGAYSPCPKCVADKLTEKHNAFWARRGVPHRLLHSTFDNFEASTPDQEKALADCRSFARSRKGFLILIGSFGTGKGHLACAALKFAGTGRFITHADIIADLRASYQTNTTEDVVHEYQDAPFLVLDEVGLRAAGKDEPSFLYRILAHRYDRKLPTAITSNEEMSSLREIFGGQLMDRIAEDYTLCVCVWPSHRGVAKASES